MATVEVDGLIWPDHAAHSLETGASQSMISLQSHQCAHTHTHFISMICMILITYVHPFNHFLLCSFQKPESLLEHDVSSF